MKLTRIAAIILTLAGASATATFAAPPPLIIAVQFAPSPPKRGSETITVRLRDARNQPVNGAMVHISTAMPAMSMIGPTARAIPKGNGMYVTSMNLKFMTRWYFTVTAQVGGKSVKMVVQRDIR